MMIKQQGMYDPDFEHDACGVGFVANVDGHPSHEIIEQGIEVLRKLQHRGATGEDQETGDGAGIMTQVPHGFFRNVCDDCGIRLPATGAYGLGTAFLPRAESWVERCKSLVEEIVAAEGLRFLGWREVPVDPAALGQQSREWQPRIEQFFVDGEELRGVDLERRLYVVRRRIEQEAETTLPDGEELYLPGLSTRVVLYKGLMLGRQVSHFYLDLQDPDFTSAMAVVHQRYSTNTFPSWKLAQPFRYLAHNGEINTLRGNLRQMQSREQNLASDLFGDDLEKVLPVIDHKGSDSSCLDNVLELLVLAGRDLPHALMMLVPQAWGEKYPIGPDLRGFFEYHAGLMEPWDGPAALVFTDGSQVGAMLDRNGLRPARYTLTKDGFMVLGSEAGLLDIDPGDIQEKGILSPGEMIIVDTVRQRILRDHEIKSFYARRLPYRRWVEENKIVLHGLFNDVAPPAAKRDNLLQRQRKFGYTREDLQAVVGVMATTGREPTGSMGCDRPLAVLNEKPQLLYSYFKQLFAQVTNPPIDPIREELVMSLMTFMGNPGNILIDDPTHARLIKLPHPVLSNEDLERLQSQRIKGFNTATLTMGFQRGGGRTELEQAVEQLAKQAAQAATTGQSIIVLSDKNLTADLAPIPALLAVSAVNQRLLRQGLRTSTSLIVETGEAREVHHFALLLGYGATAVNPYLAFETIADMATRDELGTGAVRALENYIHALCKGLRKIMSKMGISTLRSYRSAQVFEAVGLDRALVDRYFPGTPTRIGGIDLDAIAREVALRMDTVEPPLESPLLEDGGRFRFRKNCDRHLWTPETISTLQQATRTNDMELYRAYADMINDQQRRQSTLRGLFSFKPSTPVPLEEVESVDSIVTRFVTGAMSFGSLSREAHETLAIAMNRLGAMSNSGEGGEDPARYRIRPNGDNACSATKQVASGRFGVTIDYLVHAKDLQIKMAQGAKPGEGGQLPGDKVNDEIARIRHSTPGVTLISPPPHHDIYSIEDIKQLIYDLKNANPAARVSVKLVSEVGVGTIAAGVAKAHANMILISGYDGGTGASPLSSIEHAGIPWELGLSETQQTLVLNGLRERVRLQVDGQLKTGRDVVIGALLGAEEFGFASAPLVVCGCVMMRKCHQNLCSLGVATQDPRLRKRFAGKPEFVIHFFRMIAAEVREYMARLGFRTFDEMIGRVDMLDTNRAIDFWKARGLDFSAILRPDLRDAETLAVTCANLPRSIDDDDFARQLIREAAPALEQGVKVTIERDIHNSDRAVGTMLSGEIAKAAGPDGLPDDSIVCRFRGAAGQSFGAFGARGLTMILEGEANDYLGKGLSGARLIVRPPAGAAFAAADSVIAGNVLLYGATSGEVYLNGRVGERFAIRNSGARAVVEGVGNHGCEYMTGGRVVILGETGVNFGAGMSGGLAYVYDPAATFDTRCNLSMIDLEPVAEPEDVEELRSMIEAHCAYTDSVRGRFILDHWDDVLPSFVKVLPMEYARVLGRMSKSDEETERDEPDIN